MENVGSRLIAIRIADRLAMPAESLARHMCKRIGQLINTNLRYTYGHWVSACPGSVVHIRLIAVSSNRSERWRGPMERTHEFTINLRDHGTYAVKLLEGVQVERCDGATVGRWPAFDLEATGGSEGDVYQELLGDLQQRIIGGPGSPVYERFAAYVREYGARLSDEEVSARQLAQLREITVRWPVTDDEQYMVPPFEDVAVQRDGGAVTVRAFGLEGTSPEVGQALRALKAAINVACGEREAPGPRYDEFTSWARSHGERVPADVLAQEEGTSRVTSLHAASSPRSHPRTSPPRARPAFRCWSTSGPNGAGRAAR